MTASPPNGNLPFTGSDSDSLIAALFALGVGSLAIGLTSLRRVRSERNR